MKNVRITIKELEMNGNILLRILRLLKKYEPEIYMEIKTELSDSVNKLLNGEIRESCKICPHCGKYKRMQGNGILHPLCECGT